MGSFLPRLDPEVLDVAMKDQGGQALYQLLVQPLLEELYRRQDFDFMDEIHLGQSVFLAYDYVRNQVIAGGFIQCIQNGYIPLIAHLAEHLPALGIHAAADVFDQVLVFYVNHREALEKEEGVAYFASLYARFPESQTWDQKLVTMDAETISALATYAREHLSLFCRRE